jgi:hypothetical protein
MCEDTTEVIRNRKSKDRQLNGQEKKDRQLNGQDTTEVIRNRKSKDRQLNGQDTTEVIREKGQTVKMTTTYYVYKVLHIKS